MRPDFGFYVSKQKSALPKCLGIFFQMKPESMSFLMIAEILGNFCFKWKLRDVICDHCGCCLIVVHVAC
jgi:hypothetical protein